MRRLFTILSVLAFGTMIAASGGATAPAGDSQVAGGGDGRAAAPPVPTMLAVTHVRASAVSLRWRGVPGASAYEVLRNGRVAARVTSPRVRITGLTPATWSVWRVRSIGAGSARSAASDPAPVTTRAPTSCTLHVVSRTGSDLNNGSAAAPLRTVSAALNLAGPGDVVCLRGRFTEDTTFRRSGSRAAPLVIRSAPGTMATVRGRMWISDSANDVVVQGLRIDGTNRDGGELPSPTIQGDRVRLLANDITNHRHHICLILGSIRGYGVARNVIVDGNRIHNCGRRPGDNHLHGVYVESARGTRIVNNVIYANADRGIQLYPNAQDTLITRNVITGNGQGVIFSGAEGYASSGNRVVRNVITHARKRFNIEYWWPEGNPVGRRNVALRNCVWQGAWGNIALPAVGFAERGNITVNPAFRNRARGDFRSTQSSGCRDLLIEGALPLRRVSS
jgi:parallel beta-helix repeat protein